MMGKSGTRSQNRVIDDFNARRGFSMYNILEHGGQIRGAERGELNMES